MAIVQCLNSWLQVHLRGVSMEWLELVAIGLAAWRMASLLVHEPGPGQIFAHFRSLFGITHNKVGEPTDWPNTLGASLFSCVWCMSIWTAFAAWGVWQWRWEPVAILAASTIAIAAERWNRG